MISDNRGQIRGRGLFLQDGGGIGDMGEQRPVREERTARDEDDACVWPAVVREIGNGKGAAVVQHQVQNDGIC